MWAQSACGLYQSSDENERRLPRAPCCCFHFLFQESQNTETICQQKQTAAQLENLPVNALQSGVLQVNLQLTPVDKLLRFSFAPQFIDFDQRGEDVSIAVIHVVHHILQKHLQTCVQATAQPLDAGRVAQRLHQQSCYHRKISSSWL
jgi:hypothetical protein